MVVCLLESRGSTSYYDDNVWSRAGTMSQTPQPDKSFLCQLEDLEPHEQDREAEITSIKEEIRATVEAWDH